MDEIKYDKNQAHYIVVTGIVVKDGKYLIAKRAEWEPAFPGKWTVPGGKLKVLDYALRKKDTEEHWYNVVEEVLAREIKEETDLDIQNIGYITSMVYTRSDGIPCLIISLYAEAKEGEVKLAKALTELAWVNLEEAKNYDLIAGIYEELEMLDIYLRTGKRKVWAKS
ncbi:MAG: NUDIX domain-containing protein [Nanoarchaeota archaeon]|nr:NUDIX domain-containing protein [Nanoarchaeota archaeon]